MLAASSVSLLHSTSILRKCLMQHWCLHNPIAVCNHAGSECYWHQKMLQLLIPINIPGGIMGYENATGSVTSWPCYQKGFATNNLWWNEWRYPFKNDFLVLPKCLCACTTYIPHPLRPQSCLAHSFKHFFGGSLCINPYVSDGTLKIFIYIYYYYILL